MKAYFSVSELLGMGLEILPSSERGIQKKVNRENWQFREVAGRGGRGGKKREYMPPPEVQAAIMRQQQEQVLATAQFAALPVAALPDADTAPVADGSTEVQRQREGARLGVLNAIERLMAETKVGKDEAITGFLVSAQHPDMPHLAHMLRLANDRRGGGAALPSKRTIHRWFKQREESGSLLPKVPQKDLSLPEWFKRFLVFYRTPQKPSVQAAFELFVRAELARQPLAKLPSVHQARRWLDKLGNVARENGRLGSRELKTVKPYKVRDFKNLQPTDIYTADGHTFDAEVLHPDSGKPFRPEITTVADVATRKIVGWSVDLAESGYAVLSAVCHAVKTGGIPAMFYVHKAGRRLMKQEAALKGVPALGNILSLSPNLLPDFDEFRRIAAQAVEDYNNRPHRSLPKITDISGSPRHMTPNELWALKESQGAEIQTVDEAESLYLFMPQEVRVVQRGQVTLRRNVYYSADLQEYNGDRLRVAFDMHNAERVWLFDDDGRYVCHADWNGNRIDYMPVSVIEQAKEKRVAGQIKRLDNKQSILAAARPARVLEHQSRMNLGGRTLDMQALQQQAQLAMAKMQPRADEAEPPKAKVTAFRPSEPPPEGWVRPATPQARAAEFARLSALPPESWTAEQAKFMATPQVQQEAAALERMRQMYG